MATVEELLVRIDATSESLRREMRRADQSVNRGGRNIERSVARVDRSMDRLNRVTTLATRALGSFGVALSVRGLTQFATSALAAAESIGDLNQRTGVATDTIQGFRLAADQSGASASNADEALGRLSRRMGLFASREGGAAADAFRRLGIAVETTDGQMRTTEAVFREVADAIGATSSEAQAAALASEFFGETAGPQLAASLRDGSAGIDEMIDRLRETGRLFDEEMIRKSAEASAGLRDLRTAATQTIQTSFLDQLSDSLGDARDIATDPAFQGGLEAIGRVLGFVATEALRGAENVARLVDALSNLDPRSAFESLIELDPVIGTGRRVGDALRDRLGLSQTELESAQTELERQRQQMQELVETRRRMNEALETGVDARGQPVTGLRREGMEGNLENREREIAALREQMAAQRELVRSLGEVEEATDAAIGDPGGGDGVGGTGLSGIASSSEAASVSIRDLVQQLKEENETQRQLNEALLFGAEYHRDLVDAIEMENAAKEAGIRFSDDLAQTWMREFRTSQRLRREYEETENALGGIVTMVERTRTPLERYQATVAEIETLRPFAQTTEDVEALERALSDARAQVDPLYSELRDLAGNIENDFASAFEAAFSRGEDFGQALANNLRQTFTRLASEIARQLVFQPIINSVVGGLGLSSQQQGGGIGGVISGLIGGGQTPGLGGIGGIANFGIGSTSVGSGIIGAVDSFGGSLGFATPSGHWAGGTMPGAFGTTATLAGTLGAAGAGVGIGSMVSGFTGGNQLGGSIGGGLGGAAGFVAGSSALPLIGALGGPLGMVAGAALGGAAGGLFGPGPSSNASGRTFDVATGQLLRSAGGGGQNAQIAQQIAQAASSFNQQLAQALDTRPVQRELGITAADDMIEFWHHRGPGGDVEGAIEAAQRQIIDWLPGISNSIRDALGRAFDRGTMDETLSFLAQYNEGFFELNEQMTQGEAQMQALNDQYKEVTAQAKELGLSTKDITANFKALTAQMRDDFDDSVRLAILDITDPQEAALERLKDQYELQRREARALGADLGQLNRLYKLQQEQIKATSGGMQEQIQALNNALSAATGIQQWLDGQIVGQGSSLSPTERLAEAQRQFGSALSDVRGGDLSATGALTGAADTLLSLGREQFASSVDFAALERSVRSQLQGVQATITSDRFIGDQVEKAIRQSGQDQVNELQALRREVSLLRRDVQKAA